MIYKEESRDVISTMPEYVTAHCISEDCAMGAGVVLAFRKAFPGLKAACMEYVNDSEKAYMDDIYVPYRHTDGKKVVYNMFTKERYWYHAGKGISYEKYLENLKSSLEYVKALMIHNKENKLALPKIGAGLDRCRWEDVKNVIQEVFSDTDIEVLVCFWN